MSHASDKTFAIEKSTEEEKSYVDNAIFEFNNKCIPFTQKINPLYLNYVIKNEKGIILGGISSILYNWKILYIDILWVNEESRHQGLGRQLLNKLETEAKKLGCKLMHLDTFDFQAKDFYLKMGFEVFGILDDCPLNHKRYYLKKMVK